MNYVQFTKFGEMVMILFCTQIIPTIRVTRIVVLKCSYILTMHLYNKIFLEKMSYCIVHHGGTQTQNTLEFYKTKTACNTFWSDFHRYTVPSKIQKYLGHFWEFPSQKGYLFKKSSFHVVKEGCFKKKEHIL